ncbi:MBL fold metallo-hydrolase [Neptunicoccus cionae]|uniref:MBL fold metallo-hydrolase n=1 Tax=Neptunicoccus cionae TaxID=2035344 RepID=UPI000C77E40D|nr:MBL fold metallo-hydrolase [Amylibacter cionae]PLS23441.1 MBL fold metallo-hydrolase [Amylibacter cionae]
MVYQAKSRLEVKNLLNFPYGDHVPPIGDGSTVEVSENLLWARMPVGGGLGSVNIWLFRHEGTWSIIDTGIDSPETVAAWDEIFATTIKPQNVGRLVLTHGHPDHGGLAGWISGRCGAPVLITLEEERELVELAKGMSPERDARQVAFFRAAGGSDVLVEANMQLQRSYSGLVRTPPAEFERIAAGDILTLGGDAWQVVIGSGHSPEHACLYNEKRKLFIAGDQVLPKITPNVSVRARNPEADPMTHWLSSLARIKSEIPDDVLVLPSHGDPYRGLHARIDTLIKGHEQDLKNALAEIQEPKRVIDLFQVLFNCKVTESIYGLAAGEALANLHCLRTRGEAVREIDADGVAWWRAT